MKPRGGMIAALLLIFGLGASAPSTTAPSKPDPTALIAAAAKVRAKMKRMALGWDAHISMRGVRVTVKVIEKPDARRLSFVLDPLDGKSQTFADLIERDGAWYYIEEQQRRGKYRPYEIHSVLPTLLQF